MPSEPIESRLSAVSNALFENLTAPPALDTEPRRDLFHWMSELNKASTVMVVETGIVPRALGGAIARAVQRVIDDNARPGAARPGDYLKVEAQLIAAGGPDVTRMHSGRSRQDIAATRTRLFQRDDLLAAGDALDRARAAILALAARDPDAIIPAYTWGVQAQPTTLGHWLLATDAALARTAARLREAWARLNLSPLGSAALGTSSFPVDRPRLAALLGFDGVLENSFDANQVSPVDLGAELVGWTGSVALTVSLLLADVTAQYALTKPWLTITEGTLTGPSSIMPQKRNPVALVALRTQASTVLGEAQTYLFQAHNLGAGMPDYKTEQPSRALQQATRMLDALAALLPALRFDAARARAEVDADYSTTTELADVLQREADVPFRVGHHFASALVTFGRGRDLKPAEIPFAEAQRLYAETASHFDLARRDLPLEAARFRSALDAGAMVRASRGLGGPQPAEVARMLAAQQARRAEDAAWLAATRARLDAAQHALDAAFAAIRDG